MNSFIEIKNVTWQDFVDTNPLSNINEKKYIYRGQTNGSVDGKFAEWELISSFNRYYSDIYDFETFIFQQVSFMNSTYSEYEFVKNNDIQNSNTISRIYFLQHYGVPTCFIDFTFNPLIALYFSISSLRGQSGGIFTIDGFPEFYPDDYYFTIIRIEVDRLRQITNIKNLRHFNLDLFIRYDEYRINIEKNYYASIAFDLSPLKSINNLCNYNLSRQASCFLLYDNKSCDGISFEEFLDSYIKKFKIDIEMPFITKYHIRYNTAFKPQRSKHPHYISLFSFLKSHNISGKDMFNDIQGLKYDFNFFHQE